MSTTYSEMAHQKINTYMHVHVYLLCGGQREEAGREWERGKKKEKYKGA